MNAVPDFAGIRITRTFTGISLYVPPLQQPGAALLLGIFGLLCIAVPGISAVSAWPRAGFDATAILVTVLLGAFILPFIVFGIVFILLAAGLAAGSLTVDVSESGIRATRRVFGMVTSRRELPRGDIAAVDVEPAARYRGFGSSEEVFRLVVRSRSGAGLTMREAYRTGKLAAFRNRRIVVAEGLKGADAAAAVRALILEHGRIEDPGPAWHAPTSGAPAGQ